MKKKKTTLLERGQWCLAIQVAEAIHEDNSVGDTAELLMDGIKPYRKISEAEVLEELREALTDSEPDLIPYTLKELVEQAEQSLGITE